MNVAVLGGGYAGMAAAVALVERGVPVTVYEAAAHLGGRARRVAYRGLALDNGLHVLIGACSEMLRLVALVSGDPNDALRRLPLDWHIHDRFRMRVPKLPAPLHLAAALLTARGLRAGARISTLRFVQRLRKERFRLVADMSVQRLLERHGQDETAIRYLWQPLCVSALNTPIEEASARLFLNVLRDGLDGAARNSDVLVARRDLTALFPEPAGEFVRARGGAIRIGHTVSTVTREGGDYVVTAGGVPRAHGAVVCALSPHRLAAVVSGLPPLRDVVEHVERFAYQPIFTVYLQFSGRVRLPAPMIGAADGFAHWFFDREAICGQAGLVAAVISAAQPHRGLAQEMLAREAHAQLAQHFGPLPDLAWHRVIAEKRATFACTVDIARPPARTALRGFVLAGDYIESDYPATLEGAVRSGVAAAKLLLDTAR
jgi:squalene-associated FAD-dependent desaturase